MNNTLFVGIDVGSGNNVAYIMKPDGNKHSSFSVPNNYPGAENLADKIVTALKQLFISKVVIGMESTSVYGDNLMYFLRETGKFTGFEKKLHMLNPKQVKKFKDSYPDLPKNDFVDAYIIAEIGDIARFPSHASLAKYAGLSWTQHQSSEFESEDTHLIKSGNHHLRYYFCEAANSLRKCDPEFRRFYNLKFKEVTKHRHRRALVLTARKLVRLVYALLKTNRLYIPPEE